MLANKLANLSAKQGLLLAFVIGFFVRLVPELLSFPYPIGWDTIYYAYRINDGVLFGFWDNIFSSWMIYGILILFENLTKIEPFIILKIAVPLLYGGTSTGIYFVAKKKLHWSVTKSLLASVFFTFSLAGLAISWQFYRNLFGIMVLLFAIPFIKSDIGWRTTVGLSVLGLLITWGHELAAISLFFIVFGIIFLDVLQKHKISYRLILAIIPALFIFFGNFFLVSPYSVKFPVNLVWLDDSVWAHPANMFFLTDYLSVSTPIESYSSYFDLLYQVTSLFIILYALMLPLIAIGWFKDKNLNLWAILLLIGSFSCLIIPFTAILLWARWILMLIVPFSFFATNGFGKITKSIEGVLLTRHLVWIKFTKKVAATLLLLIISICVLFMSWPLTETGQGLINWPGTFKYFPSTMQASSIPLRDTEDVIEAYSWLNSNMDKNSSLLVHDTFEFWTLRYLNRNHLAILFDNNIQSAINHSQANGAQSIYIVWWNQDIHWYNLQLTNNWSQIQEFERISIYILT